MILKNSFKAVTPSLSSVVFVLVCFVIASPMRAVVPAPDGGYPGFNTAEGQNALFNLTSGSANTAVGWFSLWSNAEGNFNTATGAGVLLFNTAGANTAFGAAALLFNTTGENNTATGAAALLNNTTGSENAANGYQALSSNTTGGANTAIGSLALQSNTEGVFNTANGSQALSNNTTGDANTAIGFGTLISNTTGNDNTALGFEAGSGVTTANNVIAIGTAGANVSNGCFIGRIRDVTTANADAIPVMIDSHSQLGTISSSRRFKKEIKPMDQASEAILGLKPVTFHYKSDSARTPQFGLIAEEVAAVNPDLVVRDEKGEIYTVRYDAVNAMLLNEFLKEHRKVEGLKATVTRQQKGMEVLAAQLKEQAAQIQKVSAHLEMSRPATSVVLNNP
jgi:Chaperone of endosialidase